MQIDSLSLEQVDNTQVDSIANLSELLTKLSFESYQAILVSSVRSDQDNLALANLLKSFSSNFVFAQTSEQALGISCAYANPEQLGVDRWLGLIAANNSPQKIGIISIGTAITLDLLDGQQHLGGQIIPAENLMKQALKQTGRIKFSDQRQSTSGLALGNSTSSCVHYGIQTLIENYLVGVVNSHSVHNGIEKWVITGGGAIDWMSRLAQNQPNIEHRPRLVFEGLIKLNNKPT